MVKWNNLKHFKRNFSLVIANVIFLSFIFCYIPVSTLVMLSMLPAVIYSFYTKRWSLILIVGVIYGFILYIFFATIFNPESIVELYQNVNLIFHLYKSIYPYQINVSIIHLLGVVLMFYLSLFVFFTLLISIFIKMSEFSVMITFSYAISLFSAIYLILNVFSFLIPQMQYYMANNVIFQYLFTLFYIILPFFTLNFTVLYLELFLIDSFKRKDYEIEAKKLNKPQKFSILVKALAILTVIIFAIIIIGGSIG